jgi:hypothetical protein
MNIQSDQKSSACEQPIPKVVDGPVHCEFRTGKEYPASVALGHDPGLFALLIHNSIPMSAASPPVSWPL